MGFPATRAAQFRFAAIWLAAALAARGADAARSTGDQVRDQVLRMTEFFDTKLPGVLGPRNVTLSFKPKFGDLRDEEYIRFPIEVRYGLTDRWELLAGLVPFTPSPFNSGRDHRWGPGEARLGARYDLLAALPFFDDATVGIENRFPLGQPPVEINDHYTHVKPFLTAARTLRRWQLTTFYINLAYDRSVKLTDRSPPPPEVLRRHVIEAAPGLLYKPGQFGYFGEYRFRHIHEDPSDNRLAHEVQLGAIWDVPLARSADWKLPGKWQLELAYRVEREESRGTDHGISARVNWRTTLREVLGRPPAKTPPTGTR
jgi:hypothetical protein